MCDYIGTQCWTIPWTNLTLLDALVRSNLAFGAPVWAPKHLSARPGALNPQLNTLEVFYCLCLHTLLATSPDLRNSILYITANKHPLHVLIAKVVWRYFRRLKEYIRAPHLPPILILPRWLRQLPNPDSYTV